MRTWIGLSVLGAGLTVAAAMRFFLESNASASLIDGVGRWRWLLAVTAKVSWLGLAALAAAALFYLSRVITAFCWWSPARVFVAYHHSAIEQVTRLVNALNASSVVSAHFIPMSDTVQHDVLLDNVYDEIRRADFVLCLPGPESSFVDSELAATIALQKPLLLLLRDDETATPNTSHSSFPLLILSQLERLKFTPMIRLLRNLSGHPLSVASLTRPERERIAIAAFVPFVPTCLWGAVHGLVEELLLPALGATGFWRVGGSVYAFATGVGLTLFALSGGVAALVAAFSYFLQLRRRGISLRTLRRVSMKSTQSYDRVVELLVALDPSLSVCIRPTQLPPRHELLVAGQK